MYDYLWVSLIESPIFYIFQENHNSLTEPLYPESEWMQQQQLYLKRGLNWNVTIERIGFLLHFKFPLINLRLCDINWAYALHVEIWSSHHARGKQDRLPYPYRYSIRGQRERLEDSTLFISFCQRYRAFIIWNDYLQCECCVV